MINVLANYQKLSAWCCQTNEKCYKNQNQKAFNGASSWSFSNLLVQNFVIFGVENSSSRNPEKFLKLVEGPTDDINESVDEPEKNYIIKIIASITKFCLSLHCSGGESYLYVTK